VRYAGEWQFQARLIAPDAFDYDHFGYSVAVSGDTAVIGAYQNDPDTLLDAGAAYVFVRSGVVWSPQATLRPSVTAAYDYFGRAVAVAGNTAVIGSPGADLAGRESAGAAEVFVRSGEMWSRQARLSAADAAAFDNFGLSVAVSQETVVIGSIYDDHPGGSNAGSAYVFGIAGGAWHQQAKLTALDAASSDTFGRSVAVIGDRAVVGANQDDHAGGSNAGSAYLFVRTAGGWTQRAKLTALDAAASDFFGSSVALDGNTTVLGAPFDDHAGQSDAGATYLHDVRCLEAIPTIAGWGIVALTLLLAAAGTLLVLRVPSKHNLDLAPSSATVAALGGRNPARGGANRNSRHRP
jgi:hypothetical protein